MPPSPWATRFVFSRSLTRSYELGASSPQAFPYNGNLAKFSGAPFMVSQRALGVRERACMQHRLVEKEGLPKKKHLHMFAQRPHECCQDDKRHSHNIANRIDNASIPVRVDVLFRGFGCRAHEHLG